eukprot:3496235-Alexandrium_andersonii.AAC.1
MTRLDPLSGAHSAQPDPAAAAPGHACSLLLLSQRRRKRGSSSQRGPRTGGSGGRLPSFTN